MADRFKDRSSGLESPGYGATETTPNDSTDLPVTSRAIYVGTAGDLRVTTAGGDVVTFANLQAGILPMRVKRIHATGTTAGDIVVIW